MKTNWIFLIFVLNLGWTNHVDAQRIAAGGWHSVVICNDGSVTAFGENNTGQLGNGSNTDSNTPVSTGLTNVIAVSAGGDQLEAHSMALKNDGTVWAWGSNLYGQLGNASSSNTNTPVQTLLLNNVTAIAAGGWHSVALKNDSTVWTWGWNGDGQLGDETTTDKSIPSQVPALNQVIQIAAGTYHTLALKSDGTVWAWGDNLYGQIGNGTNNNDVTSPVQVSGLDHVVKIVCGRFYSVALKNDGTLWAWGQNLYGQLGDGTTIDRSTPVQVSGLTNVTPVISAGAFHTIAVKADGTMWSWGRNTYGNLGDNTVDNRVSPVQMPGITDVVEVANGTNFSLLVKSDGTFWACGRNASGQLGSGNNTQFNVATQSSGVCAIAVSNESPLQNQYSLNLFPNPSANGVFHLNILEFPKQTSDNQVEIFDNMGKRIFASTIQENTTIVDLSDFQNGIYFLRLQKGNIRITRKLVKE